MLHNEISAICEINVNLWSKSLRISIRGLLQNLGLRFEVVVLPNLYVGVCRRHCSGTTSSEPWVDCFSISYKAIALFLNLFVRILLFTGLTKK